MIKLDIPCGGSGARFKFLAWMIAKVDKTTIDSIAPAVGYVAWTAPVG